MSEENKSNTVALFCNHVSTKSQSGHKYRELTFSHLDFDNAQLDPEVAGASVQFTVVDSGRFADINDGDRVELTLTKKPATP
jgi:hypothetical protein